MSVKTKKCNIDFEENVLPENLLTSAKELLLDLEESKIPWKRRDVFIAGKKVTLPRWTCAYGKYENMEFHFSRTVLMAEHEADQPVLRELRKFIEEKLGIKCNFTYLNYYANNNDYIGWHSDDETDMRAQSPIVILSLGACREFKLRRKNDHEKQLSFDLTDNSLLVLNYPTNKYWEHSIPKEKSKVKPRCSLTFRSFERP
jgi:alkylated DNA repair dioxygenase AlkB